MKEIPKPQTLKDRKPTGYVRVNAPVKDELLLNNSDSTSSSEVNPASNPLEVYKRG